MIERMKLLVFAIALSAGAQTMIESGLLTGAMGTAANKAGQTTGRALGMAMGNATKALGTAAAAPQAKVATTSPASTAVADKKEEPAHVPVPFADLQKVKAGMTR